jgi:hypothetical protein
MAVAASRGGSTYSAIRLVVPNCSAVQFGAWFDNLTATSAEADMIAACPDHYLLRGLPDGRQEVVETTGGSPTATRFLVDYTTGGQVSIPTNPDYPVQIAGQAVLDDGLVIGGVRQQFRDVNGAMEALLTVEFPRVFPSRMVTEHRWHLATEFGSWINAFQQRRDQKLGPGGHPSGSRIRHLDGKIRCVISVRRAIAAVQNLGICHADWQPTKKKTTTKKTHVGRAAAIAFCRARNRDDRDRDGCRSTRRAVGRSRPGLSATTAAVPERRHRN